MGFISQNYKNIVVSLLGAGYKFKYYDVTIKLGGSFLVSDYFHSIPQMSMSVSTEWRLWLNPYFLNAVFSTLFNLLLKYKTPGQLILCRFHPQSEISRPLGKSLAFLHLSLRWGVTSVPEEPSLAWTREAGAAIQYPDMFWEFKSSCWHSFTYPRGNPSTKYDPSTTSLLLVWPQPKQSFHDWHNTQWLYLCRSGFCCFWYCINIHINCYT